MTSGQELLTFMSRVVFQVTPSLRRHLMRNIPWRGGFESYTLDGIKGVINEVVEILVAVILVVEGFARDL